MELEKAKEEFLKYTNKFDLNEPAIKRKQEHSIRVMEISNKIAKDLKLEEKQIELATLIGLLHDIARFEQYTKFHTFSDSESIDHGRFAVEILEENKFIRKFIKEEKYDQIIMKAIYNHNKFKIEQNLDEEELLFAKIIRDADKIDIMYQAVEIYWKDEKTQIEKSLISNNIYEQIKNLKQIKRINGEKFENVDRVLSVISFTFDINFKESLKIIEQEDYINKIITRFNFEKSETKNKMIEIQKITNDYTKQYIG